MRIFYIGVLTGLFFMVAPQSVHSQATTLILLRHAEKDTSTAGSTAMTADPPLSAKGELRAQKLLGMLETFHPDLIYSTNYKRTRATVTPLAQKFGQEILEYDPKKLSAFADQLLQVKGKTIIVAGHSNTTPALVNLLIKDARYPNMEDNDYGHLWIVTVTNGKAEAKMISY